MSRALPSKRQPTERELLRTLTANTGIGWHTYRDTNSATVFESAETGSLQRDHARRVIQDTSVEPKFDPLPGPIDRGRFTLTLEQALYFHENVDKIRQSL